MRHRGGCRGDRRVRRDGRQGDGRRVQRRRRHELEGASRRRQVPRRHRVDAPRDALAPLRLRQPRPHRPVQRSVSRISSGTAVVARTCAVSPGRKTCSGSGSIRSKLYYIWNCRKFFINLYAYLCSRCITWCLNQGCI